MVRVLAEVVDAGAAVSVLEMRPSILGIRPGYVVVAPPNTANRADVPVFVEETLGVAVDLTANRPQRILARELVLVQPALDGGRDISGVDPSEAGIGTAEGWGLEDGYGFADSLQTLQHRPFILRRVVR